MKNVIIIIAAIAFGSFGLGALSFALLRSIAIAWNQIDEEERHE